MFRIKNQDSVGKTIKMDMQLRLDRAKLKSPQTIEKLCSKKKNNLNFSSQSLMRPQMINHARPTLT